jgi:hypothetical protein
VVALAAQRTGGVSPAATRPVQLEWPGAIYRLVATLTTEGDIDPGHGPMMNRTLLHAMHQYYVDRHAQPNGDHEVHRHGCTSMAEDLDPLGLHEDCRSAVLAAGARFVQANGCFWCCRECHST